MSVHTLLKLQLVLALASGCAADVLPRDSSASYEQGADAAALSPSDYEIEVAAAKQELSGVRRSEGFVKAGQPTTASYVPGSALSYNSSGGSNRITRLGTGRYRVDMPGLAAPGNAQVTAYGYEVNRCRLNAQPYNNGTLGVRFDVNCVTPSGAFVDSYFTAFYQNSGDYDGEEAFGAVVRSVVGTTTTWALQNSAQAASVTRTGVGAYRIALHSSMGSTGSPFVTSMGPKPTFCNPSAVGTSSAYLDVRCFGTNGVAIDSDFSFLVMNESIWPWLSSASARSESTSTYYGSGYYSVSQAWEQVLLEKFSGLPGTYGALFYSHGISNASTVMINPITTQPVYCTPGYYNYDSVAFRVPYHCYTWQGQLVSARASVAIVGSRSSAQQVGGTKPGSTTSTAPSSGQMLVGGTK